ncbi:MAG: DUF4389 domain-containing protein [Pseudomonadota bacterium]|nr:DUF4389 domain-containing protein [Pseudomonadota bacterium]
MSALNEENLKKNVKDKDSWLRFVYLIVFGIIFYLCTFLLGFAALLQFLTKLFTGSTVKGIVDFGEDLAVYVAHVIRYLTFASDEKPFPFSPFPHRTKI